MELSHMQSPKMFLTCFIPIVLYLGLVFIFKKSLEDKQGCYGGYSILTSYLVESIEGIETVKSFNGERKVNLETERNL